MVVAGLKPRVALEHDEAPWRQLAVIGHARGDGQQRLKLGRGRAGPASSIGLTERRVLKRFKASGMSPSVRGIPHHRLRVARPGILRKGNRPGWGMKIAVIPVENQAHGSAMWGMGRRLAVPRPPSAGDCAVAASAQQSRSSSPESAVRAGRRPGRDRARTTLLPPTTMPSGPPLGAQRRHAGRRRSGCSSAPATGSEVAQPINAGLHVAYLCRQARSDRRLPPDQGGEVGDSRPSCCRPAATSSMSRSGSPARPSRCMSSPRR